MLKNLSILIILTSGLNLACNNPTGSSDNNRPEIREILLSPVPVKVDDWTDVTAVATDKDGDNLIYFWGSSEGEFFPGETASNPTRWKVLNAGNHTITCTVSDGKNTASKSISVAVTNGDRGIQGFDLEHKLNHYRGKQMNVFNDGKPYHGSVDIFAGKLEGATGEANYFYFFCPNGFWHTSLSCG